MKYNYRCNERDCTFYGNDFELSHPMSECDDAHYCQHGHVAHRVMRAVPEAFFFGPDWACTAHVGRANVGRNPSNQNRFSK